MGFSMKRWDHEKSEDDCTCQPAHDQTQPETRHGVSGSHCEAQRQNLLRSRSYLSSPLNYNVSPTQPSELWRCLLGGDSRKRDSFRLDRDSSGQASFHQAEAQDGSPAWLSELGRLGNFRAGQERRPEIRCRAQSRHRSRNFKSCPGLGQLQSSKKSISYKQQASSNKRQATSIPSFS